MTNYLHSEDIEISIVEEDIRSNNRTTVAIYNALWYENKDKNKGLVSITIGDERISNLVKLRQMLMKKLKDIRRKKAYKNLKIAWFSNIELGASNGELNAQFNPHLHIQFFYDDIQPIIEALYFIKHHYKKYAEYFSNYDYQEIKNKKAYVGYIIKEFLEENYNHNYEINKKILRQGRKINLYTSSRKIIDNKSIRYIYNYVGKLLPKIWKKLKVRYQKYAFILELFKTGEIKIVKNNGLLSSEYIIVKSKGILINIIAPNMTIKNINK